MAMFIAGFVFGFCTDILVAIIITVLHSDHDCDESDCYDYYDEEE